MIIFVDESGKFVANDKVSVVCALSLPSKSAGPARRELEFATRNWPRRKGELKGGSLSADQLRQMVEVLFRHDAIFHCFAIDLSKENRSRLEWHKKEQCEGITRYLTDAHKRSLRESVMELRRKLEVMPLQLYVQSVLMLELVYEVPQDCAHYFAQRRPRELAEFNWIIDAKEPLGPTSQEEWWRKVIGPLLETRSVSGKPFGLVDDPAFDYSYLRRAFEFKKSLWRPDAPRREIEGFDLKKMISDNVRFTDSRSDILLQAVDVLASFARRALLGPVGDAPTLATIGKLQIHRNPQGIHLLTMSDGSWSDHELAERIRIMNSAARSMSKPRRKGIAA